MDSEPEQSATDTPGRAAEALGESHPSNGASSESLVLWPQKQGHEPFARFRRRLDRMRLDADPAKPREMADDDAELRLELTLLREENARLKASRHQPSDVGRLIEQLRLVADDEGEAEALDEAWSLLTECLLIREGLERACTEIQAAIGAVQQRLQALSLEIAGSSPGVAASLSAAEDSPGVAASLSAAEDSPGMASALGAVANGSASS